MRRLAQRKPDRIEGHWRTFSHSFSLSFTRYFVHLSRNSLMQQPRRSAVFVLYFTAAFGLVSISQSKVLLQSFLLTLCSALPLWFWSSGMAVCGKTSHVTGTNAIFPQFGLSAKSTLTIHDSDNYASYLCTTWTLPLCLTSFHPMFHSLLSCTCLHRVASKSRSVYSSWLWDSEGKTQNLVDLFRELVVSDLGIPPFEPTSRSNFCFVSVPSAALFRKHLFCDGLHSKEPPPLSNCEGFFSGSGSLQLLSFLDASVRFIVYSHWESHSQVVSSSAMHNRQCLNCDKALGFHCMRSWSVQIVTVDDCQSQHQTRLRARAVCRMPPTTWGIAVLQVRKKV